MCHRGQPPRAAALAVVGHVERLAGFRRWRAKRVVEVHDHLAHRRGLDVAALPAVVRELLPGGEADPHECTARMAAEVVRFGKFDGEGGTRLRSFVLGRDPTTIKVQSGAPDDRSGLTRELAARLEVSRTVPHLAPAVLGHGWSTSRGLQWLHERVVDGRHPTRASEVSEIADDVLAAVEPLYRASGTCSRPFSAVAAPDTASRWSEAVATLPSLAPLDAPVRELLAADRDVEVGLAHGDLVATNVVVTDAGAIVLVDWEFARRRLVAGDLAKLALQASDPEHVLTHAERRLGDLVGAPRASHPLRHQVALAHVLMCTWHAHRRAKAAAAGRLGSFDRGTARRARLLGRLLGVETP